MAKRNTFGAVVMVVVMLAGVLVACGGLGLAFLYEADERASSDLDAKISSRKADTAAAIRAARPVLSRYGITEVSDDTLAARMDDGSTLLVGTGRGDGDDLKKFSVRFHVAKFGQERRWEIEEVAIDDKQVLPAKSREGL